MRDRLRTRPAGGVVGPSELDDIFTVGGYTDGSGRELAQAFSDYVRRATRRAWSTPTASTASNDADDENGYAVYLGVQCRDAAWPRDWARWRADMTRLHARRPS